MPLESGSKLGPYEILAPIGAGGMGEVYKATDTRLDRTVAIKVLPEHFAASPERRQRFDREAKAISQLNHPHICTLYDVGEQDGVDYLVMEYIEGETLTERLKRGPLSLDKALEYGVQITDGLDKAHRAAIVHRDLKPGNVMLTKSGVKLLDFGLAKPMQSEDGTADSNAATKQQNLTDERSIIGTLLYMAPEQLERNPIDARTDIFAFGAVFYEMVSGRAAFTGKSQASLIAAILEHEPTSLSELPDPPSTRLERVVSKCLKKEPDERWQTASDLADELRWLREPEEAPVTAASRAATSPLWKLATVIGFGLAIAVWALARNGAHETGPVARATLTLPNAGELAFRSNLPTMAFSRDGSRVVFVGSSGETTQLFLRSMDALEDTPIVGTEGATTPFFSYDGQWIGFLAGGELRKIAISGGAPVTIRSAIVSSLDEETFGMRGASWGPDDQIVLTILSGGLQAVPASGGEPVEITRIDPEAREKTHRFPQILPGGKRVIFTIGTTDMTTFDDARIGFASLESGEHRVLIEGGMFARYSPTGHLLYVRDNALLAVPFDPDEGVVQGTPVRILEGVSNEPSSGVAEFAIADSSTLVYVAGGSRAEMRRLLLADRGGQNKPLTETIERFGSPSVSPDGQQLAVPIDAASSHIWLLDISRGALRKLTHEWDHDEPFWTPDGDAVMYFSARNGVMNLYRHRLDDNVAEALMPGDATQGGGGSWSQNGSVVAYPQVDPVSGFDIWVWKADEGQAEPFVKSRFRETKPAFSPDGRWLAYQSDETGRNEVYVRPYPGPGDQYTISTDGGTSPVWSPRGDELFYMNGPRLMAASIRTEPEVEIGRPAQLFEGNFLPSFDVTKDGDHFVLVSPVEVEPTTEFQVVFNWFSELERLVPTE